MVRPARRAPAVVAVVLGALTALAGCSAAKDQSSDGGGAGSGGGGGGSGGKGGTGGGGTADSGAGADAMGPPASCRDIRVCIYNCAEDQQCAKNCVSAAPAAARGQFNDAQECSTNACPTQDADCRCTEECLGGGRCSELVDECDEAISDPFCDIRCH
jgi:hypothetical protein